MFKRFAVLALTILAVGACSATGEVIVLKERSEEIRPASSVALALEADPVGSDPQHAAEAMGIVQEDLSRKLVETGNFQQVVEGGQPADYTMNITLSKVTLLPYAARHFGGIYGAVNVVNGDVSLVDNASGVELTRYSANVNGAKDAWAEEGSFEGTVGVFDNKVIEGLNQDDIR